MPGIIRKERLFNRDDPPQGSLLTCLVDGIAAALAKQGLYLIAPSESTAVCEHQCPKMIDDVQEDGIADDGLTAAAVSLSLLA
jgi:hypothetical protein